MSYRTVSNNLPISIPSANVDLVGFSPLRRNPRTGKYETSVTYDSMPCPGFLVSMPLQVMFAPSAYDASRGATPAPAPTGKRAGAAAAASAPAEEKEADGKPTVPLYAITAENDRCAREHGLDPEDIRAQTAELFAWVEAFQQKFVDFVEQNSETIFGEQHDRSFLEKIVVGMIKPKNGQKAKPGKTLPARHILCKFAWGRVRLPQANKADPPTYSERPQNKTKFEMRQMHPVVNEEGEEVRVPRRVQMPGIDSIQAIQSNMRRNDMIKPVIVPKIWFIPGKAGITAELASLILYDKPIVRGGLPTDPFAESGDGELVGPEGAAAGADEEEVEEEEVVEEDDA